MKSKRFLKLLQISSSEYFKTSFIIKDSGSPEQRYYRFNLKTRNYPPASEASREVANLTERKNPHTPVPRIWCQRICLSVLKGNFR